MVAVGTGLAFWVGSAAGHPVSAKLTALMTSLISTSPSLPASPAAQLVMTSLPSATFTIVRSSLIVTTSSAFQSPTQSAVDAAGLSATAIQSTNAIDTFARSFFIAQLSYAVFGRPPDGVDLSPKLSAQLSLSHDRKLRKQFLLRNCRSAILRYAE